MVRARYRKARYYAAIAAATVAGAGLAVGATGPGANAAPRTVNLVSAPKASTASSWYYPPAATPVKHLVVIFDENNSFDHYFGTYPYAANTDGSPFHARPGTPRVNGLYTKITASGPVGPLLTDNPNLYNPTRLSHSQALTCDQNHGYTAEQKAVDNGKMDMFVQNTETAACSPPNYGAPGLVMDYFDGNTVTGLWNYAQNYAMSDNNWDNTFGPSTPGALNLISGQTGGSYAIDPATGAVVPDPGSVTPLNDQGLGTIYGDPDPAYDDCSDASHTTTSPVAIATGRNIGDLLNARGITWGWFQGGFAPTGTNSGGYAVCGSQHANIGGVSITDYSPHHEPFQYYKSTANPKHLPPSSEAAIGRTDQANHQYDVSDFYASVKDGNMPAVSFLKAPAYQDGHPGYSDPLDEQTWLVNTINQIEQSKFWKSTAIVVTYDDSDGWYDHQRPVIVNGSHTSLDASICTAAPMILGPYPARCGFSQRLPLLVISPWTRQNFVSNRLTNTSSVTRFIEDNWLSGARIGGGSYDAVSGSLAGFGGVLDFFTRPHFSPVILDPGTGEVVTG
ncbi:MAG: alkaline phosphatase family protein [Actinobacteria bacterium]|nr:alkaline phosphatase family protein [Actinomycetota bacterium]